MKKFNNRENKAHKLTDGKILWESRSVAIVATIIVKLDEQYFVLVSKRGRESLDEKGKWNLTCGYLDWDETLNQAVERELWEETGLDLDILKPNLIIDELSSPWRVHSDPIANRQNVSCHFGCVAEVDRLPELSLDNNEVEGEVESVIWLPLDDIDKINKEWAFNHDKIIKMFIERFIYKKKREKAMYCNE